MLDLALALGVSKRNRLSDAIILALFSNGEQGAYYDPYDLTEEKLAWRRNLLNWSEDFSKWNTTNGANVEYAGEDPLVGSYYLFSKTESSSTSRLINPINYPSGSPVTLNLILKKHPQNSNNIWLLSGSNFSEDSARSVFNPTDGSLGSFFGLIDRGFNDLGGGWYHFWLSHDNIDKETGFVIRETSTDIKPVCYIAKAWVNKGIAPEPYQKITNFNSDFMQAFPNHTLFQDSLGTTPVTGNMQPLGLGLDKRFGGVRGEQLIENTGNPFTNTDTINTSACDLTINDGVLRVTSTGDFAGRAAFPVATVAGVSYEFTVDIGDTIGGLSPSIRVGTGTSGSDSTTVVGSTIVSPNNKARFIFTAQTNTTWIALVSSGASPNWAEYRSIVCRPILGNHASQPVSAARPLWQNNGGLKSFCFDGLDDHLLTVNPLDLSGTSEVSVFAALQIDRNSTAFSMHFGIVGSSGLFGLLTPAVSDGRLQARITGTDGGAIETAQTPTPTPVGYKSSLFAEAKIGEFVKIKDSGHETTITNSTASGNFGNHVMYLGSRVTTLHFQGHIYNLIIRSTLTEEAQTLPIQQLLATRSGVTL